MYVHFIHYGKVKHLIFLSNISSGVNWLFCIGQNEVRDKLARKFDRFGSNHGSAYWPVNETSISESATIGNGTFIGAGCFIGPNVRIGRHCIIQPGAHLGHDVVVSDNAFVGGRAMLGGAVMLGEFITACYFFYLEFHTNF